MLCGVEEPEYWVTLGLDKILVLLSCSCGPSHPVQVWGVALWP